MIEKLLLRFGLISGAAPLVGCSPEALPMVLLASVGAAGIMVGNSLFEKRVQEFADQTEERLQSLPKETVESPTFIDSTRIIVQSIGQEQNAAKRKLFQKLYLNFLEHPESLEENIDDFETWNRVIQSLSPISFRLLMLCQKIKKAGYSDNEKFVPEAYEQEYNKGYPLFCNDKNKIQVYEAELERNGLVGRGVGNMYADGYIHITPAGELFLKAIESTTSEFFTAP